MQSVDCVPLAMTAFTQYGLFLKLLFQWTPKALWLQTNTHHSSVEMSQPHCKARKHICQNMQFGSILGSSKDFVMCWLNHHQPTWNSMFHTMLRPMLSTMRSNQAPNLEVCSSRRATQPSIPEVTTNIFCINKYRELKRSLCVLIVL